MPQGTHCRIVFIVLHWRWPTFAIILWYNIWTHICGWAQVCMYFIYYSLMHMIFSCAQHRTSSSTWLVIVLINTGPLTAELTYPSKYIVLQNFKLKYSTNDLSLYRVVSFLQLMSRSFRSLQDHCSFQYIQIYSTSEEGKRFSGSRYNAIHCF